MATSIPRPSRRATATFHGGVSTVMKVPLDTRVVISRRRAGTVRYIGRLANETGEWYGIALDEAKGDSDGSIDKERYFQCAPNHGVFVRRKEIFQMRDTGSPLKGPPSPGTADASDDCSTTCSSVAEQPEQTSAPSQSNGSTPSPLMRTFKTFRRQLENIATKSVGGEASGSGSSSPSVNNSRPASPASISSPTAAGASRTASMSGLKAPLTRRHSNAPVSIPTPITATPSSKKRQPSPPPSPTLSLSQSFPSLNLLPTEAPTDRNATATKPSPITTIDELAMLESIASSTRSASTDSADSSVAPTLTSLGFESPDLFKLPSPLPIANAPVVADNNSAAPVVAIASLDARVAPVTRDFTLELPPTLAQREQSPTTVRLKQSPTPVRLEQPPTPVRLEQSPIPARHEQSPTPTRLESNDRSTIEQRASKPVDVSPVTRKLALELSPSPTRLKLDDRSPIERRTAKPVDVAAGEQTEVTPLTSPRTQASPTPLFLRRTNIGSPSKIERRASFTSSSTSPTGSSPRSSLLRQPTASRIAELEKEIFAMRTNHENVIAVLRATNKQHAANVLELRAQVAALTEGTNYLERQLASKNALVQELQDMETHDRVTRAEVERIISLKDAQIQALEKEIGKLKQHVVRVETEKDSQLCQQFRHFASRRERDEERIAKLREDVVNMCNERISLQSELHDLREMSQWF